MYYYKKKTQGNLAPNFRENEKRVSSQGFFFFTLPLRGLENICCEWEV